MSLEHSPARFAAADPLDPLFDEVAAGIYIGGERNPLSERTLQRWRSEGKGPAYIKIGGRLIRYKKSALDAFLTAGEQQPAAQETAIAITESAERAAKLPRINPKALSPDGNAVGADKATPPTTAKAIPINNT